MLPKDDIEKLIITHQRRLQMLNEQLALYGISADPRIQLEIENIEKEIRKLQTELEELSSQDSGILSSKKQGGNKEDSDYKTVNKIPQIIQLKIPAVLTITSIIFVIFFIWVFLKQDLQKFVQFPVVNTTPIKVSGDDRRFPEHLQAIWDNLGDDGNPLGVLEKKYSRSNFSRQDFEGGYIMWWDNPDGQDYIWVLQLGGDRTWARYEDTWTTKDGTFPENCPDAKAPFGPMMGFGKIWCENYSVRRALGKAIASEFASNDAIAEFYSEGVRFYFPAPKEIWILYYDGDWQKFN